jgi:hypothetical protein
MIQGFWRFSRVALFVAMTGCATVNDMRAQKASGLAQLYPVQPDRAWQIVHAVLDTTSPVAIEEHPDAAKVVRRIYREFVGGRTLKHIATGLNRDRVPTPSHAGGWREPGTAQVDRTVSRGLSWSKATLRAVLRRQLYRGVITSRWKASGEMFEHDAPALRIIDEGVWREANRMLAAATKVYLRKTDGKLWGKPSSTVDSKYLLTGMLRCGHCGSTMAVESRPSGGKRPYVYWCLSNRHGRRSRGETCANNVVVPMALLDRAVLQTIEPYLTADLVADAIATAVKRAGSRSAVAAERLRLGRELAGVNKELANLIGFIKQGRSEAVQAEVANTEARQRDLRAALARLEAAEAFRTSTVDLEAKIAQILGDWTGLSTKPVAQQRQLLRKLIPDRLVVTPHVEAKRKWIEWHGDLAVAPIISDIAPAVGHQMPDGMGRRWWPQGAPIAGPFSVRLPVGGTLTLKAA